MSWFESVSPKVDNSTSAKPFNPEQASLAQLGAFSPLWMLFLGASAAGMAVWGMTRWMRLAAPERSEPVVRLRLVKSEPETPDELAVTPPAAELAVPIAIKPDAATVAPAEPATEAPAAKAAPAAKPAERPAKVAAPEPEAKRAAPAAKPAPEAPKSEAKAAPAEAAKPAAAVSTPAKPAATPARAAKAPVAKRAAPVKAAPKPATRRGPPRKS